MIGVRALSLLALMMLGGCQSLSERGDKIYQARYEQAKSALEKSLAPPVSPSLIHAPDQVLGIIDNNEHGDPLPPRCEQRMTFRAARAMSLPELASRLSQILQLPVRLDPQWQAEAGDPPASSGRPVAGLGATGVRPGDNPPGFPIGKMPSANSTREPVAFQPDLSGDCREILDHISGIFGIDWHWRGGVLTLDKYRVRTFLIRASATTSQFSSTMSSGGNSASGLAAAPGSGNAPSGPSSSGGGGGSAQSASVSVTSDIWSEIDTGLKTLLAQGGKYSISKAAGTITVIAPPRLMNDVADYLDQMNHIIGMTIAVEVSVIYITADQIDNYGLDLNALYQAGLQKFALTGLAPTITTSNGTASIAILSPPAGSNNFSTHFAGSQLFLNAVSSSNRLADFRSATVSGRNGVAMPVTLTTNQDIVRSLQFAVGLQSGAASTSASTSTINYGFSLQILPRLIAPGLVSVFLSFTANDLTALQNFSVGNSGSLELATIDSRSLWNESPLHVGQTLVIAGTEQEKVNPQQSGLGSPANWLFGGQNINQINRTRLILLVTPSIIGVPS